MKNTHIAGENVISRKRAILLLLAIPPLVAVGSTPALAASRFKDVSENQLFYEEMVWAVDNGILKETSDKRFRPLDNVTRAEMAEVMYNLAGAPAFSPPAQSPFTDVPASSGAYAAISWLAANGISTGWDDGTFRPSQPVTRDAMAAFIYRFCGQPFYVAPARSPFTDVAPSTQFYKEMAWLSHTGISTGWSDGTYRPLTTTKRDAMAVLAKRIVAELS